MFSILIESKIDADQNYLWCVFGCLASLYQYAKNGLHSFSFSCPLEGDNNSCGINWTRDIYSVTYTVCYSGRVRAHANDRIPFAEDRNQFTRFILQQLTNIRIYLFFPCENQAKANKIKRNRFVRWTKQYSSIQCLAIATQPTTVSLYTMHNTNTHTEV